MSCGLKVCIVLLVAIVLVGKNTNGSVYVPALENNNDYNSMVTTALFDKLNWMIREIGNINQQSRQRSLRLEEYWKREKSDMVNFNVQIRELLKQQDIKTEMLLLQMQQELMKNLDLQRGLLENTSMNVNDLKSLDVNSFKRHRNWLIVLRRQDGSEKFNRTWQEFKTGFGHQNGEFFIGLETLHAITTYADPQELLVVLQDFDNQTRYAKYSDFLIGSEIEKYEIKKIGKYQGDAGDSFSQHLYSKFSTYDQDNDNSTSSSCAQFYQGGWWFSSCYHSHLTGTYFHQPNISKAKEHGIIWNTWHGLAYSLKYAEMMIRPK